jgi:hypothetical protein
LTDTQAESFKGMQNRIQSPCLVTDVHTAIATDPAGKIMSRSFRVLAIAAWGEVDGVEKHMVY